MEGSADPKLSTLGTANASYHDPTIGLNVGKMLFDLMKQSCCAPDILRVAAMIAQDPEAVTRGYNGHAHLFQGRASSASFEVEIGLQKARGNCDYNVTPIFNAAGNGYADSLKLLIEAGGDLDDELDCDCAGSRNPIGEAVLGGHLECVKVLAEAGADLKSPYYPGIFLGDDWSGGLADMAAHIGRPDILRYLTTLGVNIAYLILISLIIRFVCC